MEYCVVENGIIKNIIVCDTDDIANDFGAMKSYPNAKIGDRYLVKAEPTQLDKLEAQTAYTAMITGTLLQET